MPRPTEPARFAWYVARALHGNTPEPLRAYSFHLDLLEHTVTLKAEVDRPLTEDERETLLIVESEIVADVAPDDSILFRTTIAPTAPGQLLDPARDGIALLRESERVPLDYRGLPPTPWAPFAWRRTPDALAGWSTHPGRPDVEP